MTYIISPSNISSFTYTDSQNPVNSIYTSTKNLYIYPNYDQYTNNYLNNIPSLNTIVGSIPIPYYQNLDTDPEIHKRMIKYYKKKLRKWLRGDLKSVLDKVKGDNIDKKIEYIEDNIIKTSIVEKILYVYMKKTGLNWVNLTKNNDILKEVFKLEISRRLNK